MTIRDLNNWCITCQEACHDHATICIVCGTTLQAAPPPSTTTTNNNNNNNNNRIHVPVLPEFMTNDLRQASREWRTLLLRQQGQQQQGGGEGDATGAATDDDNGQELLLPIEAMDPTQQQRRQRATATTTLQSIPRIVVTKYCYLFHTATLELLGVVSNTITTTSTTKTTKIIPAILGELEWQPITTTTTTGATTTLESGTSSTASLQQPQQQLSPHLFQLDNATLIIAEPRTGKGGKLTSSCIQKIQSISSSSSNNNNTKKNVIVYFERGDGITFVQKALVAQQVGAKAVIIGNNAVSPWPYIMKDTKKEAITGTSTKLHIPVVMISKSNGQDLVLESIGDTSDSNENDRMISCRLTLYQSLSSSSSSQQHNNSHHSSQQQQHHSTQCIICQDSMIEPLGQTVIQLVSTCGHVFHEACAIHWLKQQNTCPYCRQELPMEDPTYDLERRRRDQQRRNQQQQQQQQRSSSNPTTTTGNHHQHHHYEQGNTASDFYG